MVTPFNIFSVSQTQKPLQIIPYNGPPKPKQASQRSNLQNTAPTVNKWHDVDKILKVVDSICLDGKVNGEIGGGGGRGSGNVGSDNGFSTQDERKSVGFEQSDLMRTCPEDTRDESSNQPAASEGSSQENAIAIEDSQPKLDTNTDDEGYPQEGDTCTQIDDQLEVSDTSTPGCQGRECPTAMEGAINAEAVKEAEPQASRLPRRELTSTQPTVDDSLPRSSCDDKEKEVVRFADQSLMTNIEQPTQEASGHTVPEATTHQPQRPTQGKPTPENTSSGSGTDDDGNDDSDDHTTYRKRKRSLPAKRHSRTSITTSKQRPKHAVRSARQRKPSPSRGRPPSNCLSAAQYSGYDTKICYSDDSSDDSSEESSDRGRHLGSNKRPKSTARPHHSHRHKRKRNRGSAGEDEYEVEKILNARVHRGKLQYRVKWRGYEDDIEWYDASNFKNSPHRLHEFHAANPAQPGPPARLWRWTQCWEEDIDAEDHPDDSKPKRLHTNGAVL